MISESNTTMQMKFWKHTFALFGVEEEHSGNCFLFRGADVFFALLSVRGRGI